MLTRPDPIVALEAVDIHFHLQGSALARLLGRDTAVVKAVDGIDLAVERGEVLGLVGESGSGKTTLGRALLGLVDVTGGGSPTTPGTGRVPARSRRCAATPCGGCGPDSRWCSRIRTLP